MALEIEYKRIVETPLIIEPQEEDSDTTDEDSVYEEGDEEVGNTPPDLFAEFGVAKDEAIGDSAPDLFKEYGINDGII